MCAYIQFNSCAVCLFSASTAADCEMGYKSLMSQIQNLTQAIEDLTTANMNLTSRVVQLETQIQKVNNLIYVCRYTQELLALSTVVS